MIDLTTEIKQVADKLSQYNFQQEQKDLSYKYERLLHDINNTPYNKDNHIKLKELETRHNLLLHINSDLNTFNDIDFFLDMNLSQDELNNLLSDLIELSKRVENYIQLKCFNSPIKKKNAIMSIHAGSGGTEAEDWAGMLLRMYLYWASNNNFETELINITHSPEANSGIKKVDVIITGKNAYGLLDGENGVHRLIRKSPFDKSNRRHTSFASVIIKPEIDDNITIQLDERNDVRIDTLRGSGAGGQHRNKTDSAVRLTHLETGIVVFCQSERSQTTNKLNAFKLLRAKLYDKLLQEQNEEKDKINKDKNDISWGHQIRSYVLHPEQRVKDHITNYSSSNFHYVLDGNIDGFIFKKLLHTI